MKKIKRIFACVLSLLIMLASVPATSLTTIAETVGTLLSSDYSVSSNSDIVLGTDGKLTRAEWLHNLVVVFEMMVEEEAMPDNYFSDLTEEHEYYEDIILAVEFGVVDIEAGAELHPDDYATRDFATSTLNFCLGYQLGEETVYTFTDADSCNDPISAQIAINRGWVEPIDGAFSPDAYITTSEAETMLNDAVSVLQGQIVDENYESTYTFAEDVIVIPDGTVVSEGQDGKIYITDCPKTILSEDKFAVYFNGIAVVYKAVNVSFEDNITVIEVVALEANEAFSDVDAQGVISTDAMEIIPAEGVDVSFEDSSSATTFSIKKVRNITSKIPISFGGISGSVSVTIENPYIDYQVNSGKAYVALCGETKVKYEISASLAEAAGISKGFTLFTCNVGGIGSFDVAITVDFSGSASGTVKGWLVAGVECEKGGGIRAVKSFTQKEYYTTVEAETYVSLKASLGVTKMPIITAYVYADIGVKANFSKKTYSDDKAPKTCSHFAAYLFASYGLSASAKFGIWETSESVTYTIFDENNSPVRIVNHYEDGSLVPKCTRGTSYANFFTKGNSRWSGSGWSGYNGAYGLNADGTPFALYTYTVGSNGNATITKYNGNSSYVSIPETIDGYTVTAIGANVFSGKNIIYVTMPNTVTFIGGWAFENCRKLKSVDMSDSVTLINIGAFKGCINLSQITLPKTLTTLYYDVFYDCDSLTSINIPKSLTTIYSTSSLASTQYEKDGPFDNCSGLKEITFEEGITTIPSRLFAYCDGIEYIAIPSTVTVVGKGAFYECSNLERVKLSDNIITIGAEVFYNCNNLYEINLPKELTTINYDAFYNCDSLRSINIPKKIKTIYSTSSLASTQYEKDGPFDNCSGLKEITFEEGITTIPSRLFAYCDGIEEITIPSTVTAINARAFYNCTSLKKIVLQENINTIYDEAFYNCISLNELAFPQSLKYIGSGVFQNCNSLESINITKDFASGLYNYGDNYKGPFYNCNNLTEITFEEGCTGIMSNLFENCTGLKEIVIPDTVKTIYGKAFAGCSSLESVTIPKELTTIYEKAFYNCNKLKKVELPDSITTFGQYIFYGCKSLESVKLPNTLNQIPDFTFAICHSLKEISIPSTVKTIGSSAFFGCISLETVNIPSDTALTTINPQAFDACYALKQVVLPKTVSSVGNYAFRNCTSIESINIPCSVKTIGAYAFMGCEKLSNVTLEDYSVTSINTNAFNNCPALTNIILPKGLTTIGSQAFMNCTGLTEVTIPQSVTSIGSAAFSYPANTTVYGVSGSYAETFANNGGFKFVDISAPSEGLALSDFAEYIVLDRGETYRAEFITYPEETTDIITLTANNSNVTINGMEIYARNTGDTVITATASSGITYEFTVHIRNASNITVTTLPNKTSYNIGEELDLAGMVVTVTYNDGTTKEVTDYTVSGFDSSIEGTSTVTVKWKSPYGTNYTTTFETTVINPAPKLTGIFVDRMPFRTKYNRGTSFDTFGLVIKGTYTDGSVQEITDYTYTKINVLKLGEQTVTVTYGDFTCSFNVTVVNCTSHIEGEWEVKKEATATSDGERCKRCTECHTVLQTQVIPKIVLGDIDGSGVLAAEDLTEMVKVLLGETVLDESKQSLADANSDGTVDLLDLLRMKLMIAGMV